MPSNETMPVPEADAKANPYPHGTAGFDLYERATAKGLDPESAEVYVQRMLGAQQKYREEEEDHQHIERRKRRRRLVAEGRARQRAAGTGTYVLEEGGDVEARMEARADELSKKAAGERERRYAGSKEVDEWGRRRDRRGFDEAKKTLLDVQLYQHGLFVHRARYAPDRAALDAWQPRLKDANFELRAGDDGQEFWAWAETASGVVFGLAMRGGEYTSWLYVDDEPPAGGIDADERWQHVTEAAFPDW